MKIITGFILGAAAVVMVSWFFTGTHKGDKTPDRAAEPTAELQSQSYAVTRPDGVKKTPAGKSSMETSQGIKQKNNLPEKTAGDFAAGTDKKSMAAAMADKSQKRRTKQQTSQTKQVSQDKQQALPAMDLQQVSGTPRKSDNTETGPQETTREPSVYGGNKRFFWKPFSLKSKAERFVKHITSVSGVNCLVEKSGVAEYKVYFVYSDESDRLAKEALIKNTGISF